VSRSLPGFPGVEDGVLQVAGRPVRVLRARPTRASATEPQLLVHGLGGSAVTWVEVMRGLAEHGPVVAVDLPGFGRTRALADEPLTVRAYGAFVLEVADALGWDRFTLHGNSMGGLIATLLASRHPDRVERLVLVSPALPPRSPLKLLLPARATIDGMAPIAWCSLTAAALGVLGMAGPQLDERRNRELLRLIFPDPDGINRALLGLMAADFANDDENTVRERRRAMLSAVRSIAALWTDPRRAWRAVDRVQAPTLLLGGTHDALVPAKVLRAVLARRPDWEGHVLDDRRHALMMEDPKGYLKVFTSWRRGSQRAA
jgi:pimeloyl-ACP methyl ester carboxylesterase